MGKRTGRPRGAPKGNQNRLTHGQRSAAATEKRRTRETNRQTLMLLSAWTNVAWRTQKLEDRGVTPPNPLLPILKKN